MLGLLGFLRTAARSVFSGGSVPVLAVAAGVALCGFSYSKGAQHARSQCRTAKLEATVETQQAALTRIQGQLTAARDLAYAATAQATHDADLLSQSNEEADAFDQSLAGRPDHCPVSAADAERLRRIGQ